MSVLLGLLSAATYGSSDFLAGLASRRLPPIVVTAAGPEVHVASAASPVVATLLTQAAATLNAGPAGSPSAVPSSGPNAVALKRSGLRLHVWLAWPAPVLLVAHVVKSYYF